MDTRTSDILRWLDSEGIPVTGLAVDSRRVRPGEVFLAYPGARLDGRSFIPAALANGAGAVLWERAGFRWDPAWNARNRAVEGLRAVSGPLAHEVYGRPSERLWTMGVTGTNGKTSCSQWLAQACTLCGARTAVVGTLGIGFPAAPNGALTPPGAAPTSSLDPAENTTPEAVLLHKKLAALLESGAQGVAMEVSSIGLDQDRVEGVAFGAALFTNLSRDHLDYHADMESYARAKQKLFRAPGLKHAVFNLDDVQGVQIARSLAGSALHRVGYSCSEGVAERSGLDSHVEARNLRISAQGIAFDVKSSWGEAAMESSLIGRFNVSNLLGVLGMMLVSGIPLDRAAGAIAQLRPVAGRMQRLGGSGRPLVVVDYAHTPDALQQTLTALRDVSASAGGALVAVFGCGGERDRGKRALMGAIVSRQADRIVLTSDNPRGEEPEAIIADIVSGIAPESAEYLVVVERRAAVARAIAAAGPNDVVLVAGKGHEGYQEIAGVKLPYSDVEEAARALERWTA